MEDVTGLDVDPPHVGVGAPAGPVRHGALHRQVDVEDDRQVHEDHVVLGEVEVVDHRRAGHGDGLAADQGPAGVGDVVRQVRGAERVPEEVQLAGPRVELGVGGHRGGEPPVEVVAADGVELGGDLVREPGLDEGQDPARVAHDVGVRHPHGQVDVALVVDEGPLPRQALGAHVPVAVPAGRPGVEGDAVQHAVTQEPVW